MNQKLLTVLFVSVFCYGVTYSSPLNVQTEGMGLPEEKPPTVTRPTTEHINKKIEASNTSISPSNQQVNTSKVLNPSSQKVKVVSDPAVTVNITELPQRITEEALKDSVNNTAKNISSVKISSESPSETAVPTSSVTPSPLPATAPINATSSTVAPPLSTNKSTNATGKTSTATKNTTITNVSTTTTPTTTTTTTSTTIKPNPTTSASVLVNKDNVEEHNTPAPVQEKHFDGQSFFGGMALTIGLTIIGFIAFKYYKSGKIDMNYRTL